MSGIGYDASVAVLAAGTAVVAAAGLGALCARHAYHRLHFVTVMTSLGGPLIAAGLCLQHGSGLTRAAIVLPVAVLLLTGPVLTSAVGRLLAQREGRTSPESAL